MQMRLLLQEVCSESALLAFGLGLLNALLLWKTSRFCNMDVHLA